MKNLSPYIEAPSNCASIHITITTHVSHQEESPAGRRQLLFHHLSRFLIEKMHGLHVHGELDQLMEGSLGMRVHLSRN